MPFYVVKIQDKNALLLLHFSEIVVLQIPPLTSRKQLIGTRRKLFKNIFGAGARVVVMG